MNISTDFSISLDYIHKEYNNFKSTPNSLSPVSKCMIYKNRKEWYKNGKLHRDNKPAIEYTNGCKKWYKNGILYKEYGPYMIYDKFKKKWFIDEKLLEFNMEITPKKSKCSHCLENIETFTCFKTTNDNYFHEKCLCRILENYPI